ncbi:hypothetical protein, unlikely [Trypanosoma congolense IL3000]|uniref:Uncharacterized protein n=1 Tax=Trypanosoma congolense (strain IL3000) TaxID=1068625 RepID=F9WF94_TRYCI|nr:hypothetical protein, unlikely [Trypanosoma congolense IL3000]
MESNGTQQPCGPRLTVPNQVRKASKISAQVAGWVSNGPFGVVRRAKEEEGPTEGPPTYAAPHKSNTHLTRGGKAAQPPAGRSIQSNNSSKEIKSKQAEAKKSERKKKISAPHSSSFHHSHHTTPA